MLVASYRHLLVMALNELLVKQIGFNRLISDGSRFTWLADFFILPASRGAGHGKALLEVLLASPYFKSLRQMVDVKGSTEVQGLLQSHGGFSLATVIDASTATTMYKQVPNKCWDHGEEIHARKSDASRLYHPMHSNYFLSTNRAALQLPVIHGFLKTSYWCPSIAQELVEQETARSDCIALFYETSSDPESKGAHLSQVLTLLTNAFWTLLSRTEASRFCPMGDR